MKTFTWNPERADLAPDVHRRATDDDHLRGSKEVNAGGMIGMGNQTERWSGRTTNSPGMSKEGQRGKGRLGAPESKKLTGSQSWVSAKLEMIWRALARFLAPARRDQRG
jgi:hypothetical protein